MVEAGIEEFLRRSGLIGEAEDAIFTTLSGGVSSDIWKVQTSRQQFVVKRALSTLRVAQVWEAPVSRNASEVDWMLEAGRVVPDAVPQVLAQDREKNMFAMTYLDPSNYNVWKDELRQGRADPGFAARLGMMLARIHRATADDENIAERFANDGSFHALRIAPYIEATAVMHPDLGTALLQLGSDTLATRRALVHGDVSPKNILVGPKGPVLLDAECAWFGDPAFDLAFCLNHLLLKCLWRPDKSEDFLSCFDALSQSYLAIVDWEAPDHIEARAARLLPALLLARIDGKSPVEYITEEAQKDHVRRLSQPLIIAPPKRLDNIRQIWTMEMWK